MLAIVIKGFIVSFSLIIAIGSQTTFVIKESLRQTYTIYVIFVCILIDSVLMSAGVFGIGHILEQNPLFIKIMSLLGIIFLTVYALLCIYSAFKGRYLIEDENYQSKSLKQTIITVLLISLLSPHIYIDTLLLIGTIGAIYPNIEDKLYFITGAILASIVWFLVLGYGSKLLLPFFKKKITWRILDILVATIMLLTAHSLYFYL
jgi:L-lysine exporter family protein LysE/ArgO